MNEVILEPQFYLDYKEVAAKHPEVREELREIFKSLIETGHAPKESEPYLLTRPGGHYNGHVDYHVLNGEYDVVCLYYRFDGNLRMRFLRLGKHFEIYKPRR